VPGPSPCGMQTQLLTPARSHPKGLGRSTWRAVGAGRGGRIRCLSLYDSGRYRRAVEPETRNSWGSRATCLVAVDLAASRLGRGKPVVGRGNHSRLRVAWGRRALRHRSLREATRHIASPKMSSIAPQLATTIQSQDMVRLRVCHGSVTIPGEPETRNQKPETRNQEPGTRNQKPYSLPSWRETRFWNSSSWKEPRSPRTRSARDTS